MFSFLSKFSMCTQLRFWVRAATRLNWYGQVWPSKNHPQQYVAHCKSCWCVVLHIRGVAFSKQEALIYITYFESAVGSSHLIRRYHFRSDCIMQGEKLLPLRGLRHWKSSDVHVLHLALKHYYNLYTHLPMYDLLTIVCDTQYNVWSLHSVKII